MLSSKALLGVVHWGKPIGRGDHRTRTRRDGTPKYGQTVVVQLPPIIDRERFDALQAALAQRAYGFKAPSKVYPLSGAHSACGAQLGGVYRRDHDLAEHDISYVGAGTPGVLAGLVHASQMLLHLRSAHELRADEVDHIAR